MSLELLKRTDYLQRKKTHSLNSLAVPLLLATDGCLCDLCSLLGWGLGHLKFVFKTFSES